MQIDADRFAALCRFAGLAVVAAGDPLSEFLNQRKYHDHELESD